MTKKTVLFSLLCSMTLIGMKRRVDALSFQNYTQKTPPSLPQTAEAEAVARHNAAMQQALDRARMESRNALYKKIIDTADTKQEKR